MKKRVSTILKIISIADIINLLKLIGFVIIIYSDHCLGTRVPFTR